MEKEAVLQKHCEAYLDLSGVLYVRIPDSFWSNAKRLFNPRYFAMCAKYLAGVPDLLVFKPMVDGTNQAFLIELKTRKGKLTKSQEKWHQKANVILIRDFDAFKELIDDSFKSVQKPMNKGGEREFY